MALNILGASGRLRTAVFPHGQRHGPDQCPGDSQGQGIYRSEIAYREAGGTRFPIGGHREVIQEKKKKIKDADKTEKPTQKSPGHASENPNSILMELTSSNQEQD